MGDRERGPVGGVSREFPASKLMLDTYVVRPFEPADAPLIIEAINESLADLKPFMPWAHQPQTVESQVKRIRERSHEHLPLGMFWENRFVAGCGLHARVPLNPNGLEIGFWTRTSWSKRGVATWMARLMIVYAVEGLGCDRVQICHNLENTRSQRVVEKCGFVFEGVIRNEVDLPTAAGLSTCRHVRMYSLLPEEARALPWYRDVAARTRVFDMCGNDLGTGYLSLAK